MPKYKYVDGVKYRVVPQSVLGYALVREGSDNSLPSGGTEGQVLTKASDADYDVEWTTVESGGGDCVHFIIDTVPGESEDSLVLADETKVEEYYNNLKDGKLPVLCITTENLGETLKSYASGIAEISYSNNEEASEFYLTLRSTRVSSNKVQQDVYTVIISKALATGLYEYEITVDLRQYPGVG